VTLRVEAGTTASLMPVLGSIVDLEAVELLTPPTVGTLQGTLPAVTYVPPADYCGTDAVTYRVRGTNGTIDVTITFEIGILLADDQRSIELGSPTTIDVLANDRAGLELVSTTDAFAAIPASKDVLVVTPPTTGANNYMVDYIARDQRGCEGKATLTLDVGFPTRVVVGEGLTGDAFDATLSNDGRYLAFTSADDTLVGGDTNGAADVFVRDLTTNAIERVSVASNGAQANETSGSPTISADGRWVAFTSRATTLVAADTTSIEDIYLHDRTTGATTLVSISIDGGGSDHASLTPHISADGNRITFASNATRLVANDTNDVMDVFVRDVSSATTTRVSLTNVGAQVPFASDVRPRISGNGRYVALSSTSSLDGSNQSGAFLVDTTGNAVSRIDTSTGEMDIVDLGRIVVHASFNVKLLDRVVENSTTLGTGAYPTISADGKLVAFVSGKHIFARGAGAPLDVIVDRAGSVVDVTPLRRPEISGDGRWIVFSTSEWPGSVGRFVIVRVWNRAHG
jgi:Tol biopolymer transport system component